jgi:hypothetical protein
MHFVFSMHYTKSKVAVSLAGIARLGLITVPSLLIVRFWWIDGSPSVAAPAWFLWALGTLFLAWFIGLNHVERDYRSSESLVHDSIFSEDLDAHPVAQIGSVCREEVCESIRQAQATGQSARHLRPRAPGPADVGHDRVPLRPFTRSIASVLALAPTQ